jgi:hypothetical protein
MFRRKVFVTTGTLKVMTRNGDDVLTWDKNDHRSVEAVRTEFNRLIQAEKMWAYTIPGQGQSEFIRDFDPDAELIEMHEQNVGG